MTNYTHKVIPLHNHYTGGNYSIIITKNNTDKDEKTTVFHNIGAKDTGNSIISGVINTFNLFYQEGDHHHFVIYHNYFYDILFNNVEDNIPGILRNFLNTHISLHAKRLPHIKNGDAFSSSAHLIESMTHRKLNDVLQEVIEYKYNDLVDFSTKKTTLPATDDCYSDIDVDTTTIIHTDGSFNEKDNTAVTSIFNSKNTELSSTIAIEKEECLNSNTVEFLGIYYATHTVEKDEKAVIFSDSKSMVNLINNTAIQKRVFDDNNNCRSWWNDKFAHMVKELHTIDNVEFRWVKGHHNDYHNQVVDLMCRHVRRFMDREMYDTKYFPISFATTYYGQNCCNDINSINHSVNISGVVANPVELINNIQFYHNIKDFLSSLD